MAKVHKSLTAMIEACDADEVIADFGALAHSAIDPDVLHKFLTAHGGAHRRRQQVDVNVHQAVGIDDSLKSAPSRIGKHSTRCYPRLSGLSAL
jgi:hypothetical protein